MSFDYDGRVRSMLAEPRKKTDKKISTNPNGLFFINDKSNKGQQLLSKLGWEKGEGLGINNQGDVNPIKLKVNKGNKGFGCAKLDSEAWIAHQDDFNNLLADLNQENQTAASLSVSVCNLEEKSKSSRSRVHYMKFTKGKDLSRHSEKDLAMIFGRRSGRNTPNACSNYNSENEEDGCSDPFLSDTRTVTSTMSLHEYFAQKMASRNSSSASFQECMTQTPSPVNTAEPPEDKPSFYIGDCSPEPDDNAVVVKRKIKIKKDRNKKRHGRGGKVKPATPPELRQVSNDEESVCGTDVSQEVGEPNMQEDNTCKRVSENDGSKVVAVSLPIMKALNNVYHNKTKKSKKDQQLNNETETTEENLERKSQQKKKRSRKLLGGECSDVIRDKESIDDEVKKKKKM